MSQSTELINALRICKFGCLELTTFFGWMEALDFPGQRSKASTAIALSDFTADQH
jgi:hypothetical protein